MQVGRPGDVSKLPAVGLTQQQYYKWLTHRLADLHKAVNENPVESKQESKEKYDKEHKTVPPDWKVGDRVLLLEKRIKPHSNVVLSHKPYKNDPYYITELVKGADNIGTAYKLVHADTGTPYKKLVPAERLKLYTADQLCQSYRLRQRWLRLTRQKSFYWNNPQVYICSTKEIKKDCAHHQLHRKMRNKIRLGSSQ